MESERVRIGREEVGVSEFRGDCETFRVNDINVCVTTMADACANICDMAQSGRSGTVFTINLDHVVKLRRDALFAAAYKRASLVLPDGMPIIWAGKLQGKKLARVTGADLVDPLCAEAGARGLPVAVYGSTDSVLRTAAEKLKSRYPALTVSAAIAPRAGVDVMSSDVEADIEHIRKSGARICFVALGAPKQELLAARFAGDDGMVFVCIGAALDFIAGRQTRAPSLFQNTGAEWLWRLALSPRRLGRRYLDCALVLPNVLLSALMANQKRTIGS